MNSNSNAAGDARPWGGRPACRRGRPAREPFLSKGETPSWQAGRLPHYAAALLGLALTLALPLRAQTPIKAEVRAVKGKATQSVAGGPAKPVRVGARLGPGTTIKTGPDTVVDLFLDSAAGVVRVAENATLLLDKLAVTDTGVDKVVNVRLNLSEGAILGNVNKISAASKYEIKIPSGVAGIRGTRFRCHANATLVLLDGTLVFTHAPAGGPPKNYTLTAPPAVTFTPQEGVQPAAPEVVRVVETQARGTESRPSNNPSVNGNGASPPPAPKPPETYISPGVGQ